jgi:hypothetical protein
MSGMKSITLLDTKGAAIDPRYRYKKVESALNRAVRLSMEMIKTVQIWDLYAGREIATITRFYNEVRINLPRRK